MAGTLGMGNHGANFMGDFVYVAEGDKGLQGIRVASQVQAQPPESPLAHHAHRDDGDDEDGVHDRPALEEIVDNNVC